MSQIPRPKFNPKAFFVSDLLAIGKVVVDLLTPSKSGDPDYTPEQVWLRLKDETNGWRTTPTGATWGNLLAWREQFGSELGFPMRTDPNRSVFKANYGTKYGAYIEPWVRTRNAVIVAVAGVVLVTGITIYLVRR